jgi:hypothetical protein
LVLHAHQLGLGRAAACGQQNQHGQRPPQGERYRQAPASRFRQGVEGGVTDRRVIAYDALPFDMENTVRGVATSIIALTPPRLHRAASQSLNRTPISVVWPVVA